MEKFFDVCDKCTSRQLDFIFFDLLNEESSKWLKDIPGYRCRDCGEILISGGVIETIDDVVARPGSGSTFPLLKYQQKVLKASGLARDINERLLHAWSIIRRDGREHWSLMGFRTFGDVKALAAI